MSTEQSIPSLLHLHPISFSSLPPHPSLPASSTRPSLHRFIPSALTEANTFISETVPQTFNADKKLRPSSPSKARVQLSSATIKGKTGSSLSTTNAQEDGDYWVSRCSVHAGRAESGTASFDEFVKGLRDDHTENEMAYTPTVSNVEKVLEWDCDADGGVGGGWEEVKMAVTTITHTFTPSFLISPRTFLVLIITASLPPKAPDQQSPGFLNIQIPLNHHDLQNGNNGNDSCTTLAQTIRSKKGVFAHYSSVERVILLPTETEDDDQSSSPRQQRSIEWRTATTSDAGGWIPKRVQRSWTLGGVPKAVVHDVGLFLGWVDKKRRRT